MPLSIALPRLTAINAFTAVGIGNMLIEFLMDGFACVRVLLQRKRNLLPSAG